MCSQRMQGVRVQSTPPAAAAARSSSCFSSLCSISCHSQCRSMQRDRTLQGDTHRCLLVLSSVPFACSTQLIVCITQLMQFEHQFLQLLVAKHAWHTVAVPSCTFAFASLGFSPNAIEQRKDVRHPHERRMPARACKHRQMNLVQPGDQSSIVH
jgi:hypothetical protein